MKRGTKIIGILLVLVSIGALFTWEKWGKNQFLYEEILVLEENTEKGTVITGEMLGTKKMDVGEEDCLKSSDAEKVIGREAAFFVHKGVPLFPEYFDQAGLVADGAAGRYILSIPEEWQISVPKTLSRGDKAYFFVKGKFVTSALVSFVDAEEADVEVVVTDKQAEALSKIAARGDGMVIVYQ